MEYYSSPTPFVVSFTSGGFPCLWVSLFFFLPFYGFIGVLDSFLVYMERVAWKITRRLLRELLHAASCVYPNEFISMLSISEKNNRVISSFVVLPAQFGRAHAQLHTEFLPMDDTIVGTVHSHPSSSVRPSSQDTSTFSRLGNVHLFLGFPFNESDVAAYDGRGKRIFFEIVE